ncbi:MAG: calcium-binding protein, partial [Alphaproteobacteria bacterium]
DDNKLVGSGGITVSGDAFIVEGNSTTGNDTIRIDNATNNATNLIYGDTEIAINNTGSGYIQFGNDTINDGTGASTIYGDAKTLQGSGEVRAGSDTIEAGTGLDVIYGDFGDISGFTGTIYLGDDYIRGNAGHDIIYTDFISDDGFTGTFVVGTGTDTVFGGWGADTIYAGYGTEVIDGRNPAGESGTGMNQDTVYMQGLEGDYSLVLNGHTSKNVTLSGTVDGYAANITLLDIEHIYFENGDHYQWSAGSWSLV